MTLHPRIRISYLQWCLIAALSVPWLSSCATQRTSSLETDESNLLGGQKEGDLSSILEAADRHWAERGRLEQLTRAIELYERATEVKATESSPSERRQRMGETYVRLARAYFFKANAHVSVSDRPEEARQSTMMKLFDRSISAAERGIVLADSTLAEAVAGGESLAEHVSSADPDAIPALYWYATALGKWGMMQGYSTILKYQSDIQKTMQFICAERPEYYHGGCHRYFGAYWTRVPFGKSAAKSRRHLDQALEIAPYFLGNKVLMAEYYAVLAGDRDLYRRLLREVLEAPAAPEDHPDVAPENRYHKERAEHLLERTDETFQ